MISLFAFSLPPLITLATLASLAHAINFFPTGSTFELNGISYYVPPNPVGKLRVDPNLSNAAASSGGYLPLTVIKTNGTSYQSSDFQSTIESFLASDDVFQTGFLDGKVL